MRLWSVRVQRWDIKDRTWNDFMSLERGRMMFDSIANAKWTAESIYGSLAWTEDSNGDVFAIEPDGLRLVICWLEGRPDGGRR